MTAAGEMSLPPQNEAPGSPMSEFDDVTKRPYKPPPRDQLATVDVAEGVEYPSEFVVVEGVLSTAGGGGWYGRTGNFFINSLIFDAWRFPGQPLVFRELLLMRPVPEDSDYRTGFSSYSIHRFRVLLEKSQGRAVVDEWLPMDVVDPELQSAAEKLRQPVFYEHPRFGTMEFYRPLRYFVGSARWNPTWLRPNVIKVQLVADDSRNAEPAARVADRLWDAQAEWKKRIDEFAVEKLLPLKNEDWLQFWERRVSPKRFIRRMTLDAITVSPDGSFGFWHRSNLFAGHWIQVRGNLHEGPTSADIPG